MQFDELLTTRHFWEQIWFDSKRKDRDLLEPVKLLQLRLIPGKVALADITKQTRVNHYRSVKLDQQSRQQGLKAYSPNLYTAYEGHESPSLGISYTCVTTFLLVCYFSPQTTVGSKPFQGFLNNSLIYIPTKLGNFKGA